MTWMNIKKCIKCFVSQVLVWICTWACVKLSVQWSRQQSNSRVHQDQTGKHFQTFLPHKFRLSCNVCFLNLLNYWIVSPLQTSGNFKNSEGKKQNSLAGWVTAGHIQPLTVITLFIYGTRETAAHDLKRVENHWFKLHLSSCWSVLELEWDKAPHMWK